jgi:hypothetical protein
VEHSGSTRRKGTTVASRGGYPSTRSRTLASKCPVLTTPTLSPKLRKVPRSSFSLGSHHAETTPACRGEPGQQWCEERFKRS